MSQQRARAPDAEPQAPQAKVRLVIVEDEGLFRDLLRDALSRRGRFEVVADFAEGESALKAIPGLGPQVAILDIELPGAINGIQLGIRLRRQLPQLGVILLSNHEDPQFLASVPQDVIAGWSYLLKRSVSDLAALERAIEGSVAGFVVLDPQLVKRMRPRGPGVLSRLTPRQRDVLGLIAQGFTNAAIAENLTLTPKAVENQINLLYQQLGIDRTNPAIQPRVKAVLLYLQESHPSGMGETPG